MSQQQVEQIIRPTGLLDPEIILRGSASQDRRHHRRVEGARYARDECVRITTLAKKMARGLERTTCWTRE